MKVLLMSMVTAFAVGCNDFGALAMCSGLPGDGHPAYEA